MRVDSITAMEHRKSEWDRELRCRPVVEMQMRLRGMEYRVWHNGCGAFIGTISWYWTQLYVGLFGEEFTG